MITITVKGVYRLCLLSSTKSLNIKSTESLLEIEKNEIFFSGNCHLCGNDIHGEASVVGDVHYHPKCFTCSECKEPLGTDKYYIINGKNYCSKDRYVSRFPISWWLQKCLLNCRNSWKNATSAASWLKMKPYDQRDPENHITPIASVVHNVGSRCKANISLMIMETCFARMTLLWVVIMLGELASIKKLFPGLSGEMFKMWSRHFRGQIEGLGWGVPS